MTPIYERTVVGTWFIGFLLVIAGLVTVPMLLDPDAPFLWWVPLIVVAVPSLFMVLRVRLTRETLLVLSPLGFPWRRCAVADVEAYRVTRSWRETGFGVTLKPLDGKFCIAGPRAVSILLRNGRTVLVGVPDPETLVKALDRALKRSSGKE